MKKALAPLSVMGLTIKIEWDKFEIGTSVFIPCLDVKPVLSHIQHEGMRRRWQIVGKQVVEKGRYGLRCWRIR